MKNNQIKPIERPQSLCESATQNIRNAIIQGYYQLGQPLSEAMLVKTLGISKTPIREALSILKVEGLVSVIPQKGTFVFTLSAKRVAQLGQYRYSLESTAIDMAMTTNSEILVSKLFEICESMQLARQKEDITTYLQLDTDFHQAFFDHSGNTYLQDGYQFINGKIAALRTHLSTHPTHTEKSFKEHLEITNLLAKGNGKAAKTILNKHTTRGERSYSESIKDIAVSDQQTKLGRTIKRGQ